MPLGDIDAAFAKADRVAHGHHRGPPSRNRCRWSAAASIADWDAGDRAPHALGLDPVAPHVPPGPAGPDRRPDGGHPGAGGDVGGGFGLKNGVTREDVAVAAASSDLGRPVKWIEDRFEHLATGRPGPRGDGRRRGRGHRRRRDRSGSGWT